MSKNVRRGSSGSKGPVKNEFALLDVEAPDWEGATREDWVSVTEEQRRPDGMPRQGIMLRTSGTGQ